VDAESKRYKNRKVKFKINKDQNNEKLRINLWFALSIKLRKTQANKGKPIKNNNI